MQTHAIQISTNPRFNWKRTFAALSMQVGVVGVGIWAESPAMQWTGFVVLTILVIALAVTEGNKQSRLTLAQARALLDDIESKESR